MRKVERRLRERLRVSHNEEERLFAELYKVREDREEFRKFFADYFLWYIKLLSTNNHPRMTQLIEDHAKFLQRVEWFKWGN